MWKITICSNLGKINYIGKIIIKVILFSWNKGILNEYLKLFAAEEVIMCHTIQSGEPYLKGKDLLNKIEVFYIWTQLRK